MRRSILFLVCLLLSGCASAAKDFPAPTATPAVLRGEAPVLQVYVVETDTLCAMDVETYVAGVVAGEMRSDWPMEALKAQAILARTFVMKFVAEKVSRYGGADISTDIAEAQAYNAAAVDERILSAVAQTRGLVLVTGDGELPYTWFHAHSGGTTALAKNGLNWQGDEPSYTRETAGLDSDAAPEEARFWEATFSKEEFLRACRQTGASPKSCGEVRVQDTCGGGRAVTLSVDGTRVNAAELRIALGSTRMRSTMITDIRVSEDSVTLSGRGYGHGVGMPQWGAYALAEDGFSAQEIAVYYYRDVQVIRAWN